MDRATVIFEDDEAAEMRQEAAKKHRGKLAAWVRDAAREKLKRTKTQKHKPE